MVAGNSAFVCSLVNYLESHDSIIVRIFDAFIVFVFTRIDFLYGIV